MPAENTARVSDSTSASGDRHRSDSVEDCNAAHLATQAIGQHLLELGDGAHRRLLDADDAGVGGGPQPDRHGHGLFVVEQQRRQMGPGREAVAARGPGVASTG